MLKKIATSVTRSNLLKKLGWAKPVKGTNFPRKEGNTRLLGITKKLEESQLIIKIHFTEYYEDQNENKKMKTVYEDGYAKKVENKKYSPDWKIIKNEKEMRYQITAAGKRKARDTFMFKI